MINIKENRQKVLELINLINRQFDKQAFITYLDEIGYFTAPATAKYYGNEEGGLCDYSLKVYNKLIELNNNELPDTNIIVGLFNDISKSLMYKIDFRNKKIYSDKGSKYDENGNFDWVSVKEYSVIPLNERQLALGNNEQTSEYMLRYMLPLFENEIIAILNSNGGTAYDSVQNISQQILLKNKLTTQLFCAKLLAMHNYE